MSYTLRGPYTGPEAWTAAELASDESCVYRFSAAALDEIDHALVTLRDTGKPLEEVEAADFKLPGFERDQPLIEAMLRHGRGVAL
ncbi:MAG: hypothetical protein ACKVH0_18025, partial [Alphaproteobacteria bacterium]